MICRGLWRGTSPTVARLALGVGVHFLALEFIKDAIHNYSPQGAGQKHGQLSAVQAFLSGGLSRGVAAAVTNPITVVKTRMEYVSASSIQYKVGQAIRNIACTVCSRLRHHAWSRMCLGALCWHKYAWCLS